MTFQSTQLNDESQALILVSGSQAFWLLLLHQCVLWLLAPILVSCSLKHVSLLQLYYSSSLGCSKDLCPHIQSPVVISHFFKQLPTQVIMTLGLSIQVFSTSLSSPAPITLI